MATIARSGREGSNAAGLVWTASQELASDIGVGNSIVLSAWTWTKHATNGTDSVCLLARKRGLPRCRIRIGIILRKVGRYRLCFAL